MVGYDELPGDEAGVVQQQLVYLRLKPREAYSGLPDVQTSPLRHA